MECDADDFDWVAAAAAIDNISLLGDERRNRSSCLSLPENRTCAIIRERRDTTVSDTPAKLHQKSILNFVQRSNQHPVNDVNSSSDHEDILDADRPSIDLNAANTWIYPVNVPMREYQFSIVQTALFSNTLVSLPTGLGKTLIAAVVMHNFFRWFPKGKIVFTAPSRPLVLQQVEACHHSVGIPQEWTIDMTGQMNPEHRAITWKEKRVFFVTPQVFERDIESGSCPIKDIVCLVVDEAHRAMGNYSYCVVVRKLMEAHIKFRILALTATPGSKQVTIQAVIDNLHISCLEYRSEDDPDVRQYTHNRKLELLQVPMDAESMKIKDLFLEVLQPLVNRLCSFGVFYSKDAARLVPYEFLTARDKFRQAPPPGLDPKQFNDVEACFGATITLYHMFKLLFSHGIRPSYEMLKQKLQSGPFARLMGRNEFLQEIKVLMQKHVGNGAASPKLIKLQELMIQHFTVNDPGKTRVIIFTNFRESVKDILETLKNLGEKVKAMEFIGQSSGKGSKGQSQKVQQEVLQKFRMGGFNTIVATSIAEEGLDIMEVDLVICFDANISPLRMIQRMGRTGRKRDGRVIVLASEGAEFQGYLKKQSKSKIIGKHMHNGGINSFNFHSSPRMVPHVIKPEVQLVELSITKFVPRVKNKSKTVQETLNPCSEELTVEESLTLRRYIEAQQSTTAMWKPSLIAFPHCQLVPTKVHTVRHSPRTISMLIGTLQLLHESVTKSKDKSQVSAIVEDDSTEHTAAVQVNSCPNLCSTPAIDTQLNSSLGLNPSIKVETEKILAIVGHTVSDIADLSKMQPSNMNSESDTDAKKISHHELSFDFPSPLSTPKDFTQIPRMSALQFNVEGTLSTLRNPADPELENNIPLDIHFDSHKSIGKQSFPTPIRVSCHSHVTQHGATASSPHCIFLDEIVSVDAEGYVQIASPPRLPFEGVLKCHNNSNHLSCSDCPNADRLLCRKFGESSGTDGTENVGEITNCMSQQKIENIIPLSPAYFVASTPEEKIPTKSKITEHVYIEESNDEDSPRLCTLADQGVVPSSPVPKFPSGSTHVDGNNEMNVKDYSGSIDVDISRRMSQVSLSNDADNSSRVPTDNLGGTPITTMQTPVVHLQSSSNSLGWKKYLDTSSSIRRPRKFRRLRKVKESERKFLQRLGSAAPLKEQSGKWTKVRSEQSRKQRKSKVEAAVLMDEEAEVSSGEEVSADEDEADDEPGSLQDFINDEVESTSTAGESVDMMAIYRKSLLTQSPFGEEGISWNQRTPTADHWATLNSDSSLKKSGSSFTEKRWSDSNLKGDNSACRSVESVRSSAQERKRRLSFHQENWSLGKQFDDPFLGIDLDALEVEAVQMSRSHVQPTANPHTEPLANPTRVTNDGIGSLENENLMFSPSFNLGFDF